MQFFHILRKIIYTLRLFLRACVKSLRGVQKIPQSVLSNEAVIPVSSINNLQKSSLKGIFYENANVDGALLSITTIHALTFPYVMDLVTEKAFPFPLLGSVHVSSSIHTENLKFPEGEEFYVIVTWDPERDTEPHARGSLCTVSVKMYSRSQQEGLSTPVWSARHKFLFFHRRRSSDVPVSKNTSLRAEMSSGELVSTTKRNLQPNFGLVYAAICGDYNPIHIHPLFARLFGMKSTVAHGMGLVHLHLPNLQAEMKSLQNSGVQDNTVTFKCNFVRPFFLPNASECFVLRENGRKDNAPNQTYMEISSRNTGKTCVEMILSLP